MYDLLIRGATILDGTGGRATRGDVAVHDGRIAAIGDAVASDSAARTLEADGLAIAPGFIDMHSHADFTLPSFPGALNSLAQGVTSEVIGNCGYSPAPLADDQRKADAQRAAGHGLGPDLAWDWGSFGSYLDRLEAARPAVNCIPLVGHGTLRLAILGGEDRRASAAELGAMRTAAADALAAGAWGMSTGLVYPPGSYAPTDELVAVGEALAEVDAIYASHIRNENDLLADALLEAVAIGRRLGVRVQISHLKAAGARNHGRADEALAILAEARAAGGQVTQDAYPYTAGSTLLTQLLPPWVHDGGTEALIARLGSAEVRARIAVDIRTGREGWPNYAQSSGGWHAIRIAAVADRSLARLEGRTVADVAAEMGGDPLALVLDTIRADRGATTMIVSLMDEADVDRILADPFTAIGSDQLGVSSPEARVHPRAYGTFARVLRRSVRERHLLELPEAIRRMTGLPASILRLADRGRIATGLVADLVLFDPDRVADASTDERPTLPPAGVEAVLLAGRFAVDGGRAVDPRLGQVLRRPVSGPRLPHRSG